MQHTHTLTIQGDANPITIGTVDDDPHLLAQVFEQRQRVYHKYGYIHKDYISGTSDQDEFDNPGLSTHIAALRGDRLIGSIRLIHTDPLPIERFFTFEKPDDVGKFTTKEECELSRLVIERTDDDRVIPRNILMLFMANIAHEVAQEHGYKVVYAYVKKRLLKKLNLLRSPFKEIDTYMCTYPQDGFMAPYFYEQEDDPVIPAYTNVDEGSAFLDAIVRDKNLFDYNEATHTYTLRHTMYTRFLRHLGIVR